METNTEEPKELMRLTSDGQLYVDGELVPEEVIKETFKHILNQEDGK